MATGMINGGQTRQPSVQPQVDFDEDAWQREPRPGGIRADARYGSFPQGNWEMNVGNKSFGAPVGLQNSISVEQLYQDFLTNNPHADPQAAFMAGVDVGMGQVDNFSDMPYDPSAQPDVASGVDTFTEQLPIAGSHGGVEDFTAITVPPSNPGGFQSPGFVPGGLPGTGVDPNAGIGSQRQKGPEVDMTEFGISPTGQRNVRGA